MGGAREGSGRTRGGEGGCRCGHDGTSFAGRWFVVRSRKKKKWFFLWEWEGFRVGHSFHLCCGGSEESLEVSIPIVIMDGELFPHIGILFGGMVLRGMFVSGYHLLVRSRKDVD